MARCSDGAADLHDLMLCCEERGWTYGLESSAAVQYGDEEMVPAGHRARVTTSIGYGAEVLGTNARDALRAALVAVEKMADNWLDSRPAWQSSDAQVFPFADLTRLRAVSTEPAQGQVLNDGAVVTGGYARAQMIPDVPSVTWQAVATDRMENGEPARHTPKSAEDLVQAAYRHYCERSGRPVGTGDWWDFRNAIWEHLRGYKLPADPSVVWAKHEMPDRDEGNDVVTPEQVTMTEPSVIAQAWTRWAAELQATPSGHVPPRPDPRGYGVSMVQRVIRAFDEFKLMDPDGEAFTTERGAEAFASAVQRWLGGCFVPAPGHRWDDPS